MFVDWIKYNPPMIVVYHEKMGRGACDAPFSTIHVTLRKAIEHCYVNDQAIEYHAFGRMRCAPTRCWVVLNNDSWNPLIIVHAIHWVRLMLVALARYFFALEGKV